jgi:hypothetical protein
MRVVSCKRFGRRGAAVLGSYCDSGRGSAMRAFLPGGEIAASLRFSQ